MQKKLLLPLFLILSCFSASAQRYADLEIKLYAPVTGDTIWVDDPFLIDAYIKNLGPDTVQFQDTLAFELLFDSSAISFNFGSGFVPYIPLTGLILAPGDSAQMAFNFTLFSGWDTGTSEICVGVKHLNTADTLLDTLMANNRSCAMMTVMEFVTVKEAVAKAGDISVYPNPARDNITVSSADVISKVELYNLQGQKVIVQAGTGNKTDIDISQVAPGMYILKVNGSYISRVVKE